MIQKMGVFALIILLLVVLSNPLQAEGTKPGKKPSYPPQGKVPPCTYEDYQKELKNCGKGTADFTKLRMSYTRSPHYDPYTRTDGILKRAYVAESKEDLEKTLPDVIKILRNNFTDADAHMAAIIIYKRMNKTKESEFHRYVIQGLVNSIIQSGDGLTPETAWTVISPAEEYTMLRVMGLKFTKQTLIEEGGHTYDKMEAYDREKGETRVLYFNIDIPFDWLGKTLNKTMDDRMNKKK